jgi:hypothetical protein
VRSNGKWLRFALFPVLLFVAGCGGINVSKSVSPLDFLLPGLMQADPPAKQPDSATPAAEPVKQVAKL